MERDPTAASAEYLAEFRRDIESFIGIEASRPASHRARAKFHRQAAFPTSVSATRAAAPPTP
jgi:hypothetical protein